MRRGWNGSIPASGRSSRYLQERGLYDNSIIILASDHGESLGTDGNWGHQFFLFPEDVRIPLIVRLPPAMRERFTTDLARVTLLRDVAPTLLRRCSASPSAISSRRSARRCLCRPIASRGHGAASRFS